jgi:DNA excision repair protein ERCC-3
MQYRPENPLIIQSDLTLLLETMGPHFTEARDALARFAELVKSPEYVHTWRISPLSLWNAASAGGTVEGVVETLQRFAKYDVPPNVPVWVRETMSRYGRIQMLPDSRGVLLVCVDAPLATHISKLKGVKDLIAEQLSPTTLLIPTLNRGLLKQLLVGHGHPVKDLAGFIDGDKLDMAVREVRLAGKPWGPRAYQHEAAQAFLAGPDNGGEGGSGVVVLPCGAGKTIVGIQAMVRLGMRTLILCTNVTALRQWRDEILDKTTLSEEEVGEFSGERKEVKPVTLTTYQMLTWRKTKDAAFVNMSLFDMERWGLVIYDEVHLLPAPIFRTVAQLQAKRRLGLTATLVREDGLEGDVFALIGPKRFDVPWRDLEHQGWIAAAKCCEVRVDLATEDRYRYAVADDKEKFRMASTNARKAEVAWGIIERHPGARVLVIGMYVDQLKDLSERWGVPLITGETRQKARDELYARFRTGDLRVLILSRVGNFSVDLPDANVAIQVSGTWGSRQEEAQRLGRVLRPKSDGNVAWFYSIVSRDTTEQEFGEKRQLFLTEQGYAYEIEIVP